MKIAIIPRYSFLNGFSILRVCSRKKYANQTKKIDILTFECRHIGGGMTSINPETKKTPDYPLNEA